MAANGADDVAHWKKGNQMRYKAMFIAGFAVGFVAGARSGRGTYDKLVGYGRQVAEHPKVQQATNSAQAKATELGKTAAAKAPEYAKSAASSATSAAKAASAQVPTVVSNAKHAAADKLPRQFGGNGKDDAGDDVGADGNLVYPADADASSANGVRYTPDSPDAP
ncbi:MAG TPA: hypothetical protein VHZ33_27050 [Trebonia sp.]|jgi:hypothetical protein|nr:hypothetical protein [Trebonia sp.]